MKTGLKAPRLRLRKTQGKMIVNIEIFGVEGYVHDVLKAELQEKLDNAGIRYKIDDFVSIDDFISEGLDSVPAVRINHKRRFTKKADTPLEAFVQKVYDYIVDQMVQTIICPVDFSEHSINAARWAHHLAVSCGMRLKLVHIFLPLPEIQYSAPTDVEVQMFSLKAQLEKLTQQLVSDGPNGIAIDTEVELGDPVHSIIQYSKNAHTGFVVIGTHGSSQIIRKILGSVSGKVAKHAHAPVFLVPPDTHYVKPTRIMVAFQHTLVSNGQLKSLLDLNKSWKAHIDFVHVSEEGDQYDMIKNELLERLTSNDIPGFSFDIHEISPKTSVIETLIDYGEKLRPDIVVLVARHRNIVQRILQPGTTGQLKSRTQWPLLVLHEE